jgi:hypothetical protein
VILIRSQMHDHQGYQMLMMMVMNHFHFENDLLHDYSFHCCYYWMKRLINAMTDELRYYYYGCCYCCHDYYDDLLAVDDCYDHVHHLMMMDVFDQCWRVDRDHAMIDYPPLIGSTGDLVGVYSVAISHLLQ